MRPFALALIQAALLAAAMASTLPAQDRETDWGRVQFFRDRGLTQGQIAGPADSAWRVVRRLVEEAGIPVRIEDRAGGRLGNQRLRVVRRLGRNPVSSFLSCGDNMTGPNADTYHVFLTFFAHLSPAGPTRTGFQLELHAEAIDIPGGRPDRLPCATTGLLELRLVDRLEAVFPGTK